MSIDLKDITKLRNQTGAGVADCKDALTEADGDFTKAVELLRKKGAKIANKRADKDVSEGIVYAYIHSNKKMGAIVELNCETDFVAKNQEFVDLANNIAMQVTASSPLYLSPDDVDEKDLEKVTAEIKEALQKEGKPDDMIVKITEGKINKWYEEVCLLKQPFIKDEDITIEELLNEKIATLGEKIQITSFCRKQI